MNALEEQIASDGLPPPNRPAAPDKASRWETSDDEDRPRVMLLSEGQMSDDTGAALMLDALPRANALPGDRGSDADWFRVALADRKITACIPSKKNWKVPIPHDATLYRQRHKIESMFGKLKDRRRMHTRYDRCARTFMSAICIAAAVILWPNQ